MRSPALFFNPVGWLSSYIDFIVDTGDLTDYGTPLETLLLKRIGRLPVPYLFAAGNHDSPAVIEKLKKLPNVKVLQGNPVREKGLVVAGFPDPSSTTGNIAPPPLESIPGYAAGIKDKIAGIGASPDVLAVHNHRIAARLAGVAPVLLFGHNHQLGIEEQGGSVMVNSGSTGAAGIRGLQATKEVPYTMSLLHFQKTAQGFRLSAVDTFQVYGMENGFSMERRVFEDQDGLSSVPD